MLGPGGLEAVGGVVAPVADDPPVLRVARARFQLYNGGDTTFWRLLGGNNWCFGRSATVFASLALAEDAARLVSSVALEGTYDISSDGGRAWSWLLQSAGVQVARSESLYGRRVECMASIKRFRTVVPDASVTLQVKTVRNVRS